MILLFCSTSYYGCWPGASLEAFHAALLVYLHVPFLAPDISELGGTTGGVQHLGPLAVETVPGTGAGRGDEAGHLPQLAHLKVALAAPDRPRRDLLAARLCVVTMLACAALVTHGSSPSA